MSQTSQSSEPPNLSERYSNVLGVAIGLNTFIIAALVGFLANPLTENQVIVDKEYISCDKVPPSVEFNNIILVIVSICICCICFSFSLLLCVDHPACFSSCKCNCNCCYACCREESRNCCNGTKAYHIILLMIMIADMVAAFFVYKTITRIMLFNSLSYPNGYHPNGKELFTGPLCQNCKPARCENLPDFENSFQITIGVAVLWFSLPAILLLLKKFIWEKCGCFEKVIKCTGCGAGTDRVASRVTRNYGVSNLRSDTDQHEQKQLIQKESAQKTS